MSTVVIGLSIGMLLFLLAAGLTLIFGMLGVINFAHGALYALGAYAAWQTIALTGNFWIALLVAPLVVAMVGVLFEVTCLRPLYASDHVLQLLVTFGLILVLEEFMKSVWGQGYKNVVTPQLLAGSVNVAGSEIAVYRLFVIGLGLLISGALFAVIELSPAGMVLRAAESHSTMVRCLGIRIARVRTLVFAAGAGLAALGGAIAAPLLPTQPNAGFTIIIDCFVVVVLGGLGNIRGAVISALVIGMTRAVGQQWFPTWVDVTVYSLLVAALVVSPNGVFNRAKGRKA